MTYSLQVTNNGPSTANTVVVTDVLPDGVNFVSVSPANVCSGPPVSTNGTVTCTISTLAMGVSVPITIITSTTSASGGRAVTNTASVNSATSVSDHDQQRGERSCTGVPSADLAITKTASPNPVNVNGALTYYRSGDEQRTEHGHGGRGYGRLAWRSEFLVC